MQPQLPASHAHATHSFISSSCSISTAACSMLAPRAPARLATGAHTAGQSVVRPSSLVGSSPRCHQQQQHGGACAAAQQQPLACDAAAASEAGAGDTSAGAMSAAAPGMRLSASLVQPDRLLRQHLTSSRTPAIVAASAAEATPAAAAASNSSSSGELVVSKRRTLIATQQRQEQQRLLQQAVRSRVGQAAKTRRGRPPKAAATPPAAAATAAAATAAAAGANATAAATQESAAAVEAQPAAAAAAAPKGPHLSKAGKPLGRPPNKLEPSGRPGDIAIAAPQPAPNRSRSRPVRPHWSQLRGRAAAAAVAAAAAAAEEPSTASAGAPPVTQLGGATAGLTGSGVEGQQQQQQQQQDSSSSSTSTSDSSSSSQESSMRSNSQWTPSGNQWYTADKTEEQRLWLENAYHMQPAPDNPLSALPTALDSGSEQDSFGESPQGSSSSRGWLAGVKELMSAEGWEGWVHPEVSHLFGEGAGAPHREAAAAQGWDEAALQKYVQMQRARLELQRQQQQRQEQQQQQQQQQDQQQRPGVGPQAPPLGSPLAEPTPQAPIATQHSSTKHSGTKHSGSTPNSPRASSSSSSSSRSRAVAEPPVFVFEPSPLEPPLMHPELEGEGLLDMQHAADRMREFQALCKACELSAQQLQDPKLQALQQAVQLEQTQPAVAKWLQSDSKVRADTYAAMQRMHSQLQAAQSRLIKLAQELEALGQHTAQRELQQLLPRLQHHQADAHAVFQQQDTATSSSDRGAAAPPPPAVASNTSPAAAGSDRRPWRSGPAASSSRSRSRMSRSSTRRRSTSAQALSEAPAMPHPDDTVTLPARTHHVPPIVIAVENRRQKRHEAVRRRAVRRRAAAAAVEEQQRQHSRRQRHHANSSREEADEAAVIAAAAAAAAAAQADQLSRELHAQVNQLQELASWPLTDPTTQQRG